MEIAWFCLVALLVQIHAGRRFFFDREHPDAPTVAPPFVLPPRRVWRLTDGGQLEATWEEPGRT